MADRRSATVFGIETEMLDLALSERSDSPETIPRRSGRPAAVVLGGVAGDPPRAELGPIPELGGSGVPLNGVAAVDRAGGAARLPIAYSWIGLQQRERPTWEWNAPSGAVQRISWQEAISLVCAQGIAVSEPEGVKRSDAIACIATPNSLDLDAQDSLRRAVNARCRNATLLWRPVAAALSWLDRYGGELRTLDARTSDERIGRLLIVDLGLASFEATSLDLVRSPIRGDERILAARRLPEMPVLHGEGVRIADTLALRSVRATDPAEFAANPAAAWHLVWCTDFLVEVIDGIGASSAPRTDLAAARSWLAQFGATLTTGGGRRDERSRSVVSTLMPEGEFRTQKLVANALSSPTDRTRRWLDELRLNLCDGPPFLGTVAVGVFSRAPCPRTRLGEIVASLIAPQAVEQRVLIEGADGSGSLIASGAARFGILRQAGRVPYLDSLPDIRTLLQRRGEPEWARLLRSADSYVPGGESWRGHVPGSFGVRAEEQELRLTVSQEGEPTVREVDFTFPAPVERDTAVELHVDITPGQGNPRVEVIPDDRQVFAGRRLYLDWRRCQDTGKTRQQAADEMERIFPPLEPRQASRSCWWAVEDLIRRFVATSRRPNEARVSANLVVIRGLLRQRDGDCAARNPPDHATAVGSDGTLVAPAMLFGSHSEELLQAFQDRLVSWLDNPEAADHRREIYRILGYCSYGDEHFQSRLMNQLSRPAAPAAIEQHHLVAMGNCLRDAESIGRFSHQMAAGSRESNDWLRALSRIVQYRANATEKMEDRICYELLQIAHRAMLKQLRGNKAQFIYRHASLCVAYLLRRRRYSSGFLDPASVLAQEIKETMQRAAEGLRAGWISNVRGFVDLAMVTDLIIDYIDRRGKGRIVLLTE